jgi:preprotein translocase subunit SecG
MSVHLFPTHLDMHQRAITAYSFFNVATAIWATLFVLIAIVVAVAAATANVS